MKILLIGGLGYIGSTVVESIRASSSRDTVTILDPLIFDVEPNYFHRTLSDDRFRFVKGDVANMRLTWDLVKRHDVVVYMASLTMPTTAKEPEEGIFVNRYMAEVTGDCCAKLNKHMVFMSTCSNYGVSEQPVDEEGDLFPVSMYARTKVDAENYLLKNVPNTTILRCATAYGVGAGRTRWDVLFNDFVQKSVSEKVLDIFQPDACRPICHVYDIAEAIRIVAALPVSCGQAIYNVGSDSQNYTKMELAKIVADATGAEIEITKSDDDRNYRVDFGKISKILGFKVRHTPESALQPLVEEWLKNQPKDAPLQIDLKEAQGR